MSLNITVTDSLTDGTPLSASSVIPVDSVTKANIVAANGGSGTKLNFDYYAAGLQVLLIEVTGLTAGQQVTLTIYSDVKGTQAGLLDTVTLTQGKPIKWQTGAGACPLQTTTDAKSLKVVNSTGSSATVDIVLGING